MEQVVYSPRISSDDKPIALGIVKTVRRMIEGDSRAEVPIPMSTLESSCKSPAILKKFVLQELGKLYKYRVSGDSYLFSKTQ